MGLAARGPHGAHPALSSQAGQGEGRGWCWEIPAPNPLAHLSPSPRQDTNKAGGGESSLCSQPHILAWNQECGDQGPPRKD